MKMLELTLENPPSHKGTKILVNPQQIAGVVPVDTSRGIIKQGYTEISFAGMQSTYAVQESYDDVKNAIMAI